MTYLDFLTQLADALGLDINEAEIALHTLRVTVKRKSSGGYAAAMIEFSQGESRFLVVMGDMATPAGVRPLSVNLRSIPDGVEKATACVVIEAFLMENVELPRQLQEVA